MFHFKNNLFFGRLPNGAVRILKFATPPAVYPQVDEAYPGVLMDVVIDEHSWCSVIASVSKPGETGATYDAAKLFHGIEVPQPPRQRPSLE